MEKKKQKKFWVRPIFRERRLKGEFHTLIQDLKLFDSEYFFKQFRMTPTKLEELLSWVAPKIESQVSGVNRLVLSNVSALHFVTLLLEMYM